MIKEIRVQLLFVVFLAATFVMTACGAKSFHSLNSFVAEDYPPMAVGVLAQEAAATFAENYPPGHTVLFLNHGEKGVDELGAAFEEALRGKGFTVVPDEQNDQALTVAYVLDQVDEKTWYLRLTVSDGFSFARPYFFTENDVVSGAATALNSAVTPAQSEEAKE